MSFRVDEIAGSELRLYDRIPSRFTVRSILTVEPRDEGLAGFEMIERALDEPYEKDYEEGGNAPSGWPARFPGVRWGFLLATDRERPIGAAAVALGGPLFPMGRFQRKDLAVLWDIRVSPDARGRGVGAALLERAADWARAQGSGQLGMETQNVNVSACRFYARHGCRLGAIHRFGYAACSDVAHEVMLLWYLDL